VSYLDFKVGDLVKLKHSTDVLGLVIEVGYNMWGEDEDDNPRGVRVLWQETNEIEYVYDDELHKVSRGSQLIND